MVLIAGKDTQLTIDSESFADRTVCSYKVAFPISAGLGDTLTLTFPTMTNAQITYAHGVSFTEAVSDPEESDDVKMLVPRRLEKFRINFPESLYVTVLNTGSPGAFSLRYIHRENNEADAEANSSSPFEDPDRGKYRASLSVESSLDSLKQTLTDKN